MICTGTRSHGEVHRPQLAIATISGNPCEDTHEKRCPSSHSISCILASRATKSTPPPARVGLRLEEKRGASSGTTRRPTPTEIIEHSVGCRTPELGCDDHCECSRRLATSRRQSRRHRYRSIRRTILSAKSPITANAHSRTMPNTRPSTTRHQRARPGAASVMLSPPSEATSRRLR